MCVSAALERRRELLFYFEMNIRREDHKVMHKDRIQVLMERREDHTKISR